MEHGLSLGFVVAVSVTLLFWSALSDWFERWHVSAPMVFVAAGLFVANGPTRVVHVQLSASGMRDIAELALAFVLFSDAARVSLRELRGDATMAARLLFVGLPLTAALATLGAHALLPGLSWWVCAVVGVAASPTDAALGAAIVDDPRVPLRIRSVLNVESGLNDGIATPFVNVFLVAAVAGTSYQYESDARALGGVLLGVIGGVVIGYGGGWLLKKVRAVGLGGSTYLKVSVAALALLAYAGIVLLRGNGFVAAFVAGIAYRNAMREECEESLTFTHNTANLLSLGVWFIFGTVMLRSLQNVTWRDVTFALLALTVLRMAPVALVLSGLRLDWATRAVVGWFGPRGLATVVFALLALEHLPPEEGGHVVTVLTLTVLASVVLHGASAGPIARRYAQTHR